MLQTLLVASVLGLVVAFVLTALAWRFLLIPIQRRLDGLRNRLEQERLKTQQIKTESESKLLEVETKLREINLRIREETQKEKERLEQEIKERREEIRNWERRLTQREDSLDKRTAQLEQRERKLQQDEHHLQQLQLEVEQLRQQIQSELHRIAALSPEEARQIVLARVEEGLQADIAKRIYDWEERFKQEVDTYARKALVTAMQRCAVEVASEMTITAIHLPSDEMKGRIIGREGRNIRTFEMLTGVDLIVDDTPEAVVISCFDPIRRETAKVALEMLVTDGRIHPARIEEVVEKARQEIEKRILQAGEEAIHLANVDHLPEGLLKLLGRLKFRTSYGQNVLDHSVEVSYLAGKMADEIKANSKVAKRAGLFHDIGKALDHHMEGSHVMIGMEILRRFGESEEVIHAMSAHHGDFPPQTVEAVLVTVADSLSASRPGARRESFEAYIRRLEQLENIAKSFNGVEKAYVIQAGREVRVIVKSDQVDDALAVKLAKDIAQAIQQEVQFPGQIKVTVMRETRAIEYAR